MEGTPMRRLVSIAGLALAMGLSSPGLAAAQFADAGPPPSCLADWSCARANVPLGLYVRAVDDGGRYITLEDGSLWEVEISDRALAAGWQPDDFVGIRTIWAPRGDFDILLTRAGYTDQRVATRLAGRRQVEFRTTDTPPGSPDPE
jgi:hypothetical protein